MIKHIMTHLPPKYAPFLSSYNTHKLTMGSAYIKPSFETFLEMLVLVLEFLRITERGWGCVNQLFKVQ